MRRLALPMLALALPTAIAVAGDFNPLGDGSQVNNADLLRDPTTGCENCQPPPHEWDDPWFDLDWSLAFRGAYVQTTGGNYFEASVVPSMVLRHETLRGGYEFSASAELHRSTIEELRLGAVRLGFEGDYRFDTSTVLSGNLNLALTRDSANKPGTLPTVAEQSLVVSGDGEVQIERELGPLVFTGRGNAARTVYGPTTLLDASVVDNSYQNNWRAGGGLRLGYRVTPILTAFVDGSVEHQWYDGISPTYLVKLDATDYEGRIGASVKWHELLEAETSIGYGLRRFAEPALGEASSVLYDASLTFRPDETLEIRGAFTTSFGAPGANSAGTARLEYAATGDVAYRVNPWLRLRASAGWRHAELIGTTDTDSGYSAGLGADYLLNEHTTLTGDYAYSYGQATPSPATDEHRVTLGIAFSR